MRNANRDVRLKPVRKSTLSLEDRDVLYDVDPDVLRVIVKDMEAFVLEQEALILGFTYRPGKDDELKFLKTKAQGAREFFNSYVRRLEKLKSTP